LAQDLLTRNPKTLIKIIIKSLVVTTAAWYDGFVEKRILKEVLAELSDGRLPTAMLSPVV